MNKVPHGQKPTPASDAGQKPPTEANPVRQRYQMGCHEGGSSVPRRSGGNSFLRIKSRSRGY